MRRIVRHHCTSTLECTAKKTPLWDTMPGIRSVVGTGAKSDGFCTVEPDLSSPRKTQRTELDRLRGGREFW